MLKTWYELYSAIGHKCVYRLLLTFLLNPSVHTFNSLLSNQYIYNNIFQADILEYIFIIFIWLKQYRLYLIVRAMLQ